MIACGNDWGGVLGKDKFQSCALIILSVDFGELFSGQDPMEIVRLYLITAAALVCSELSLAFQHTGELFLCTLSSEALLLDAGTLKHHH